MPAIMVYVLAILFVLVNITSANFDLHHSYGYQGAGGWPGKELEWWKITNDDPVNRDKIDFNAGWGPSKDVSHDYRGVRCEGKCGYKDEPWPGVNVIEMHFTNNPSYHFTIYKDRGHNEGGTWYWTLYGTDGNSYGSCFAYGGFSWSYDWPEYKVHLDGYRKFRCLTEVDADTINAAANKEGASAGDASGNTTAAAVTWTG